MRTMKYSTCLVTCPFAERDICRTMILILILISRANMMLIISLHLNEKLTWLFSVTVYDMDNFIDVQ